MNTTTKQFILGQKFLFDSENNLLIDQSKNVAEPIRLGSNESRILKLLVERPNEVVTRHQLHEYVWREQGFEVDDSSLTQAISTLRKMLQDPTKSPQFVRTVPKRGYQLISSVDLVEATKIVALKTDQITTQPEPTQQEESEPYVSGSAMPIDTVPHSMVSATSSQRSETSLYGWLIVVVAIILPLFVNLSSTPEEVVLKPIVTLQQVEILTPANHNDVNPWLIKIEQCVSDYIAAQNNKNKPVKAIVTAQDTGQISINFIHNIAHSSENNTIRIFGAQQDLAIKCE